jgi:hypothetical protein
LTVGQILKNPATDKSMFGILNPDIALAREIIFTLYASNFFFGPIQTFGLDELGSKGACRRRTY